MLALQEHVEIVTAAASLVEVGSKSNIIGGRVDVLEICWLQLPVGLQFFNSYAGIILKVLLKRELSGGLLVLAASVRDRG